MLLILAQEELKNTNIFLKRSSTLFVNYYILFLSISLILFIYIFRFIFLYIFLIIYFIYLK